MVGSAGCQVEVAGRLLVNKLVDFVDVDVVVVVVEGSGLVMVRGTEVVVEVGAAVVTTGRLIENVSSDGKTIELYFSDVGEILSVVGEAFAVVDSVGVAEEVVVLVIVVVDVVVEVVDVLVDVVLVVVVDVEGGSSGSSPLL